MGDNESWRIEAFRKCIVSKIEEAIRQSGMTTPRNSLEMENYIFQKSRTQEEYLAYVARLILHVREMSSKNSAVNGVAAENLEAPGLQTVAIQGTRNRLMKMRGSQGQKEAQQQVTATNLRQTLNRGPGQTTNPNMEKNLQPHPSMGIGPNDGPLANQIGNKMGQMTGQISNQIANQLGGNQMVASPALVPSPSSQMSTLATLNTPGQHNQSPIGMQDKQAYREKVRQLSKYIEPLTKVIAHMENNGEHVEEVSKMKKLLEILSNPQQRVPLETLKKCEVVLEIIDLKQSDGNGPTTITSHLPIKEHHVFNPFLTAITNNLRRSMINSASYFCFGCIIFLLIFYFSI